MPYNLEAIRQGIWEEMERDPTSFAWAKTSAFTAERSKVTEGFINRFGSERVIDAAIADVLRVDQTW